MKRFLATLLVCLCAALALGVWAQTSTNPAITRHVGNGTGMALASYSTASGVGVALDKCLNEIPRPATGMCKVSQVNTAAPVCPSQPASSVQSFTCTSPNTGTQTRTTIYEKNVTPTTCSWTAVVGDLVGTCTPPPPVVVPPVVNTTWSVLSKEGIDFTLTSSKVVRFGFRGWEDVGSKWTDSKTLSPGTYKCSLAVFAVNGITPDDPKPGSGKACEVSNATVIVDPIPPAPTPPVPPPSDTSTPMTAGAVAVSASAVVKANADVPKTQNPVGGWAKDMLVATSEVAPASDIGAFRTGCQVTKYAFDDPIVYPGQPGKSHLHTFFGNTGIDAYSTATSLSTTGNSTCRGGTINRSSYWVPSMIDTRTSAPLAPMFESNFYYKSGYALPPTSITEVPLGLRMIAGDAKGSPTAPSSAASYACVWNGGNSNWSKSIPTDCPGGDGSWLIMGIDFPQCWDGANLDSPDHKSHMTNPVNVKANNTGNCPATHPVALPQIAYQILYQVKVTGETKYWRLSSDNYDLTKPAGYSGHGDYFMAWKPEIVKAWTKNCDNAMKDCHSHLLGDGRMMVIP